MFRFTVSGKLRRGKEGYSMLEMESLMEKTKEIGMR